MVAGGCIIDFMAALRANPGLCLFLGKWAGITLMGWLVFDFVTAKPVEK